jgi:hypothetical protein
MKRIYILLAVVAGILLISATILSFRPGAKDFFLGSKKCRLTRAEFDGQGVDAILTDSLALAYLDVSPKVAHNPEDAGSSNRWSAFEMSLYDKWGRLGWLHVDIRDDTKVVEITYFDSSTEDWKYLLMGSNAPPKLKECFDFLVEPKNRGKKWDNGNIGELR